MITLDLAPLLRQSTATRRIGLWRSFLAGTLPRPRPLIGATALWNRIVLALITTSGAIMADGSSRIATYLTCATAMPTNSGLDN